MMKKNNHYNREFSISTGWVVALSMLLAAPLSLLAQDTGGISGRVYNEFTGDALQGAIVRVVGTNTVDRTGLDGRFYLSGVPAGSQQLSVNYVGMDSSLISVSVAAGQTQVVSVNMTSEIYDLEAFTVVGQVIGQARAINMQKTAAGIINIISEEQFGAIQDGNIGQALQRLPGISVDEDGHGEQGAINIRGIEGQYNLIQMDGNTMPSSGGDRDFNPVNILSDGITTIEVIKAPTPDRDGDAIGGIVNLVTRSAFQREGREMSLKLAATQNDLSGNWGNTVIFSYSDLLSVGDGDKNLGISFTLARYDTDRFRLNSDMDWIQVDVDADHSDNDYLGLPTDRPVWFMESTHYEFDNRETEKYSIRSSIDYRLDENNSFYFRPSYSTYERVSEKFETDTDIDTRFQNKDGGRKTYAFLTDSTGGGTDPNSDDPTGNNDPEFDGSRASYGWIGTIDNVENTLYSLNVGGRHERTDSLLTWDLYYSKNKRDRPRVEVNMRTDRGADTNFIINYELFDVQRGDVSFDIINGIDPTDLSLLDSGEVRDRSEFKTEEVFSARLDWEKTFSLEKGVFTFKAGAKYRVSDQFRDRSSDRFDFLEKNFPEGFDEFPYADLLTSTGDEKIMLKTRYWQVKTAAAKALLISTPELFDPELDRIILDSNVDDYDATETTTAFYVMGTYETGIHTLIFGVRHEDVEWENVNKTVSFLDKADDIDIIFNNQGDTYDFWLPSVHGRHALTENLILRESYNRSYGRPDLTDLSKGRETDDEGNIEEGNSQLQPALSDNFDIQLEYYTKRGGLYSIGFFYKEIEAFSFDRVFDFTDIGSDGVPIPDDEGDLEYEQPVNGTNATNKGIELIARQQLYFLPGPWAGWSLGFTATFSDSKANIPSRTDRSDLTLPGFSDKIYTATIDYAWSGFSARLDYRFRGDFIEGLGDDIESDEFFAEEFRLDAEVAFRIRPGIVIYASGTNLTDEPQVSYQGFPQFVEDATILGAKYTFGIQFDF